MRDSAPLGAFPRSAEERVPVLPHDFDKPELQSAKTNTAGALAPRAGFDLIRAATLTTVLSAPVRVTENPGQVLATGITHIKSTPPGSGR